MPDLSIPLTTTGEDGNNQQDASNPLTKDGKVTTTVATGNKSNNSDVASLGLPKNGTDGSDQEANYNTNASSNPFSQDQTHKYTSPFLSESGKPYNSRSHVNNASAKGLQSYLVELVLVAELMMLLDSMGATKTALEKVLKWHSKAVLKNASFQSLPVTRDTNMAAIRNTLPRRMVESYLPYVKQIQMCGFNNGTNVVGPDIVPQILSLLHSPSHMTKENLVLNLDNHFDNNYYAISGQKNANKKISCARAGSVYQNYIKKAIQLQQVCV